MLRNKKVREEMEKAHIDLQTRKLEVQINGLHCTGGFTCGGDCAEEVAHAIQAIVRIRNNYACKVTSRMIFELAGINLVD
jgi:hypothetical protein